MNLNDFITKYYIKDYTLLGKGVHNVRDLEMNRFMNSELTRLDVAISIKKVIYNPPATIVFWADGTKTVVKCAKSDDFDQEKGLAMCICKKIFNNDAQYHKTFRKFCTEKSPAKTDELTSVNFMHKFKNFCISHHNCRGCDLKKIDQSLSCENILKQYPEKAVFVIDSWYSQSVYNALGY